MIDEIKQAFKDQLRLIYPDGYIIYDEELPEEYGKPSFYLTLVNQTYNKLLSNRYESLLSFDIAYYSDHTEIRTDCLRVQQDLLRGLDMVGGYRVFNRNAKITDSILHITFEVKVSEIIREETNPMQQQQINFKL